jgi:hypothetical protein
MADGFFSVGDYVCYTNNIDTSYSQSIGNSWISSEDSEYVGKNCAGNSLSLLFSPFTTDSENKYISAKIEDVDANASSGIKNINNYYLSKYTQTKDYIISDANLADNQEDLAAGDMFLVPNGEQNIDSIRGIALSSPIFAAGYGITTSGTCFTQKKCGPIDLLWNDRNKMWEARQTFPMPGVIAWGSGNPYMVWPIGFMESGNYLIRTGTENVGEEQSLQKYYTGSPTVSGVYNLYEGGEKDGINIPYGETLCVGDFVTIFYDGKHDKFTCVPEKNKILVYNNTGSEIPPCSAVEIVSYVGKTKTSAEYHVVAKPSADNLTNILITDAVAIPNGKFSFIKSGYPKSCCFDSVPSKIKIQVGTKKDSFSLFEGKTGFIYNCYGSILINEKYALSVSIAGGSGGIFPIIYVKGISASSSSKISVKYVDINGMTFGDSFDVYYGYGGEA